MAKVMTAGQLPCLERFSHRLGPPAGPQAGPPAGPQPASAIRCEARPAAVFIESTKRFQSGRPIFLPLTHISHSRQSRTLGWRFMNRPG